MRWFRRAASDDRLDLELRDHIERQVADYMSSGMSELDARRRVRIEFGGLEQAKEHVRDVRPHQWFSELVRDARVGWRGLRREPLFALSVIVILTVAIGAGVAMFSVLHTVVLRALPYPRASELAMIRTHLMLQDQPDGTSLPNWFDWRRDSKTFAGMTLYLRTAVSPVTFAGRDAPQRGQAGLVGPDFFEVLGTTPLIGRTPSSGDFDRRERVVVLSEGLWQEQFARLPDALGRTLVIDGQPHTIIGVMPHEFQIPSSDTRLWRPISVSPLWDSANFSDGRLDRDGDAFEVIGRLAPKGTLEEARAEMRVIAARLRDTYESNKNLDVRITPLFDYVIGEQAQRGVWLGFAAVLALLAIACTNVGGLLSVRAMRRRQEFAVRSALGAGRWRLIRQLLAESVVLWAIASAGGVALAYGFIRLLLVYGPRSIPRIEQVGLDVVAVTAALLGGLLVIIVCGTIPSLIATRMKRAASLATRDQSSPPQPRLQDGLVATQIAGALVLLVGALLFAESFLRAQGEDPGYAADNLMIVRIELPRTAYRDDASWARFFNEASARLKALPGVAGVGGTMDFFMRRNGDQAVTVEGRAIDPNAPRQRLTIEGVTPGFFDVAGIELVEGRMFDERDLAPGAAPVYIVNELMARQLWPGERAVGKRIVSGRQPRKDGRWDTVVGVVRNVRREGLDLQPFLTAYNPANLRSFDLVIRATTGVDGLIASVRRELQAVDASIPLTQISTVRGRLSERLSGRRFQSQALGLFAAIALVLAAAGLYALLAYQVTMRTREIGIRSALGADRRSIVTMVFGHGVRLAVAGVLAGMALAASGARLLQSLLYNTQAIEVSSYVGAALGMLVIAGTAACVPAFRAARVSPMTALREG